MKVKSSEYLKNVKPLLKELLNKLEAQYSYCSILANDSYSKKYSVSGYGVSALENDLFTSRGFVVRIIDEKGYGEYSFNHIDSNSIADIVKEIEEDLMPLKNVLPQQIGFFNRPIPQEEKTTLSASTDYEVHPNEIGDKEILSQLTSIRESGKAISDKILDCIANLSYQEIHKLFLSKEKDMEQNILWTTGAIVMAASRGQEVKQCYHGYSNLGGAEILSGIKNDVKRVAETTLELLDSEEITPGEYDCVCSPSVTGMIVHEAFGHGVEMDMFVKDRALAKSFINKYVASPLVTMHDGAAAAKESGSYFFDDEGTMAHDTIVIDHGILKQGISDLLSAQTLDTPPTGNGRRESFERKAYTRMTNTYFEGGQDKLEDMIASIDYGFLLEEPSSGMEDPKNWGIQCMVNIAREIKDGKLTGKIFSPIVLTGYVPELLKSISMMSENVELEGGGMCGKGYKEWVKVSDGGPYIKAKIRLG